MEQYDKTLQGERRHMTPENLTPIVEMFDEKLNELKKELKEDQREYIQLIERTYIAKVDHMTEDIKQNAEDHKIMEERINERFLQKVDVLNSTVKSLADNVQKDQDSLEKKIEKHEERIGVLEKNDAEKAKNLLNKIKENALAWLVPTILIILAMAIGINIPK